ncbi:MAG: 3'-5' exonuclease [Bacteroidota bacterium]|nr:3'-5' exonuclease [Bacteroidota bacterium]
MDAFTAIDFETANGKRWSICQVGLVRVQNGQIIEERNILIQPPDNYYHYMNILVHGITTERTLNSPTFAEAWPEIEPFIKGQHVVAHNGFGFDFNALSTTLKYYGLSEPEYEKHCTYKIYNDNLASLCNTYKIPLNHHDALSDARACAELFLKHLNN